MIKKYTVNLINVKSKADLLYCFNKIFDFAYPPVDSEKTNANWDSFDDSFQSLDTESKTFIDDPDRDKITGIHLVLENYKALDNIDPKDKKILEEIIEKNTHKENRYDELDFSYEIKS
ncbi:MAG: hypothetical protein A2921_03070 [Candidatus Magasanikbacteria bacterium RIFCSPLOWO2_01_FULL_43_20b]|uniref:Barstar (barnase inhibitor) domain-containing protein n=1 Tax=Candidatus Magasanikbacteria bacterium RIFCSPLOWO2_12_FULL_43_12 TaxID=1798692 RepID=A0A1F6MVQ0_9BACT|nr:MAG: hypothetical protein A3C74_04455 [Candidatus Magasanikbacteria bacterium RIFCSPHIGHO2_02_FULL_44_13]OGH71881.1 MAG: hypothetical protein A3I93_01995 [Candidatus Magasanikbacteria bacterium RIFCSPLOWO2_02_FULL_43_22]OGH72846.1 MAG: hypothetical protein A2921_03070 [Candidatus Magasanikbacteria bacterium RIFCSPLOWO2_01_FULL_43_20b]OGH75747.1 MAG: hypothetical protein A3G00_03325 [Candidatus Magasanikbacteria bacterium RIFCSPLOWO2_12_FULL_43_12]